MAERLPNGVNAVLNIQATIDGAAGVYVSLMTVIVIAAAGVGLVLFAFGTLCLLSLRIQKITPRALLLGE